MAYKVYVIEDGKIKPGVSRADADSAMIAAETAMQAQVDGVDLYRGKDLFFTYRRIDDDRFGLFHGTVLIKIVEYAEELHPRSRFVWGSDDLTIIRNGETIYEAGSARRNNRRTLEGASGSDPKVG